MSQSITDAIRRAATLDAVIKASSALRTDPITLVIGLIAKSVAQQNRTADRIARSILANMASSDLALVTDLLEGRPTDLISNILMSSWSQKMAIIGQTASSKAASINSNGMVVKIEGERRHREACNDEGHRSRLCGCSKVSHRNA
jgi:hypothetical protein